jgi:hypothetical protein
VLFNAIEIEEGYLKLLADHKEKTEYDLVGKMANIGYTLDQYHADKEAFIFEATRHTFKPSTHEELFQNVSDVMAKNDTAFFVTLPEKKWIYVGKASTVIDPDASVLNINHFCNSLLATAHDIGFTAVVKQRRVLQIYKDWLESELVSEGIIANVQGAEVAFEGYSVYYFLIAISDGDRERMVARWL